MKHTVEVTQDDIACGARHQTESCPIALALERLPNVAVARVYPDHCYVAYVVSGQARSCRCALPQVARDFIALFDDGAAHTTLPPFAFELELPDA